MPNEKEAKELTSLVREAFETRRAASEAMRLAKTAAEMEAAAVIGRRAAAIEQAAERLAKEAGVPSPSWGIAPRKIVVGSPGPGIPSGVVSPPPAPKMSEIERIARQGGMQPQIPAGTMFDPVTGKPLYGPPAPPVSALGKLSAGAAEALFDPKGGHPTIRMVVDASGTRWIVEQPTQVLGAFQSRADAEAVLQRLQRRQTEALGPVLFGPPAPPTTISDLEAMGPQAAKRLGWEMGWEGGWHRVDPSAPFLERRPATMNRPAETDAQYYARTGIAPSAPAVVAPQAGYRWNVQDMKTGEILESGVEPTRGQAEFKGSYALERHRTPNFLRDLDRVVEPVGVAPQAPAPITLTGEERNALMARGYTKDQILDMRPSEARRILTTPGGGSKVGELMAPYQVGPEVADPEEVALAARAQAGDRAATEELVKRVRGLVLFLANKMKKPGIEVDDLIQEGMIGALEAVKGFDPTKGKWSSWAAIWIRGHIRGARALSRVVPIPSIKRTLVRRFWATIDDLHQTYGAHPGMEEVRQSMGLTVEAFDNLLAAATGPASKPMGGELAASFVPAPVEVGEAPAQKEAMEEEAIKVALATVLTPREAEVFWMSVFEGKSTTQISARFNARHAAIKRNLEVALEKLRAAMKSGALRKSWPGLMALALFASGLVSNLDYR